MIYLKMTRPNSNDPKYNLNKNIFILQILSLYGWDFTQVYNICKKNINFNQVI